MRRQKLISLDYFMSCVRWELSVLYKEVARHLGFLSKIIRPSKLSQQIAHFWIPPLSPSMLFQVPFQPTAVGKFGRTWTALVRLLASVHPPMDSQLTGRVESLVTFGAPERSLVAVRSEVHRSRVVCPKMLRALGAWVRPFPRVVADVALQVASLSET